MRCATRRHAITIAVLSSIGGAGCTFLVDFDERPIADCDGGACIDATAVDADAGVDVVDASSDARDAAPEADADPCATLADGAVCSYVGGCNCGHCDRGACTLTKKCPEGYNWDKKNDLARCCGGLAVLTNTNANCGVCGVVCKTAGVGTPQDCQSLSGKYLCVGCTANSECWSQCCSSAPGPSHCAASDCNTGACPAGICPAPSRCVAGTGSTPNSCTYN